MKNNKTKVDRDKVSSSQKDNAVLWITQRLISCKKMLLTKTIGKLEWLDGCVTGQRRKLAFYVVVMCCSGCLLYLLGSALRQPVLSFTRPFMPDSVFNRPQTAAEFLKPVKEVQDTVNRDDSASSIIGITSKNSTRTGK